MDGQTARSGECPVCFQVPRAQIFQCVNGHSLCDQCSIKVTACPTCRSRGVRIRNRLAESLLDEIYYNCSWSVEGCPTTLLRGELSTHVDQCDYNPNIFKLCSLFIIPANFCQRKFNSIELRDSEYCNEFVDHIKTHQDFICYDNVQLGKSYTSHSLWNFVKDCEISDYKQAQHYFRPKIYRFKKPNNGQERLYLRIILLNADVTGNNKTLSWALVQLTAEKTPIVMRVTINGDANSKMVSEWGQKSSPALTWTVKSIKLHEFKKMVEGSQGNENRLSFPYSLPVPFLSSYYVGDDGMLSDTVTFKLSA